MDAAQQPDPHMVLAKNPPISTTKIPTEMYRQPLSASQTANALTSTPPAKSAPALSSSPSPATDLASRLANWSLQESPDAATDSHASGTVLESPTLSRRAFGADEADGTAQTSALAVGLGDERSDEVASRQAGNDAFAQDPSNPQPVVDELALFTISSRVTELLLGIQDINTLLFEVQELRHTTSNAPSSDSQGSASTDTALMRLDAKMDEIRKEYVDVEMQVHPLLARTTAHETGELVLLRQKWSDATAEWDTVQQDADVLSDELKEDKWLAVFRTVSSQATDMMRSLDKALVQSHTFVTDVHDQLRQSSFLPAQGRLSRSPSAPILAGADSSSLLFDSVKAQHLLASFHDLRHSLRAKVKYYSPACARVLSILQKGIADRSTKNGEVLRRFSEMQTQWKTLQERVQLAEHEMSGVEQLLKHASAPASKGGEQGSTLTPLRNAGSPDHRSPMRRSPSSFQSLSLGYPPTETPTRGGPLKGSASSPTIATLGTVSSPDNPLRESLNSSRPTPPRPPKSLKRLVSDSHANQSAALTPPRAPFTLNHRRSMSAMSASYAGLGSSLSSTYGTRPSMQRPVSPAPDALLGSRPRWNSSVKPLEGHELQASAIKPRTGRTSSVGLHRPPSRTSLASSMSRSQGATLRPVSPAFSDASSVARRDRPETPSKIPRPSSVLRRQSGAFPPNDPDASLLFESAVSPTPSTASAKRPPLSMSSRYSLSRSMGPPPSASSSRRLSTADYSRTPSRPTSPALSSASASYYRSAQTPEPSLMAQAQRLAGVRAPSTASRPPPVPRVPSTYRQDVTPMSATRGTSSGPALPTRPASSLASYRLDRSTTPLPADLLEPGAYVPNPCDPLDVAIASLVNSLPLLLRVIRVDPPLHRHATVEVYSARYTFKMPSRSLDDQRKPVMCKLVDRLGPRSIKGEKKVVVRVGGGWQDLEAFALGLMAHSV